MEKVLDFVEHTDLDKIIITMFEEHELYQEHYPLIELCRSKGISIEGKNYGYAWQRDEDSIECYPDSDFEKTWCYGTRDHHEENDIIEIEEWQHEIKRNNDFVYFAGAFAFECLADGLAVLNVLNIDYKENKDLSVGYGFDYEYKGEKPSDIQEKIQDTIFEIEEKIKNIIKDNELDEDIDSIIKSNPFGVCQISDSLNILLIDNIENIKKHNMSFSSEYDFIEEFFENVIEKESKNNQWIDMINNNKKKPRKKTNLKI
jgi:hypothetical protein